jgi:hypothetical protein
LTRQRDPNGDTLYVLAIMVTDRKENPLDRLTLHPARLAATLAAVLALAGCATPYVVALPTSQPGRDERSMEKALKYLDDVRSAYRNAVVAQVGEEQTASNAFIGAGALVAALAVGKVHRDAVLGVTGAAGMGYALTNNNLPRVRLQLHIDAVRALNCAERATLPLAISDKDKAALNDALLALRSSQMALETELRAARAVRNAPPGADPWRESFVQAEATVNDILAQTRQSLKAGDDFVAASDRAAALLGLTVAAIGDNTVAGLANARSPLAEVPRLVQGVAQDIGGFAPGAGVDALVTESLKKSISAGKEKSSVDSESDLGKALVSLDAAARDTARLQAVVNNALRGRNTTLPPDAFKDCDLQQVVAKMVVTPAPLKFSASEGGQRVLSFSGGVEPYFLQLDGGPVAGLSFPVGPIRGRVAEVTLNAGEAKGGVKSGLRASDSSAAGQEVRIEIEVVVAAPAASSAGADPKPAAAGGTASGTPPNKPPATATSSSPAAPAATSAGSKVDINTAVAALTKTSKFSSGGVKFERQDLPVKIGDRIEVTVLCPEGNTKKFDPAALVRSYLSDAGVMGFPPDRVTLKSDPPACTQKP